VEQEQEEPGDLGGSRLKPRALRARLAALSAVVLVSACGRGSAEIEASAHAEFRSALVGQTDSGLRIVAETIAPPAYPAAPFPEEELLRRDLRLDADRQLLRIHLVGEPGMLQARGRLSSSDGAAFEAFGPPPAGMNPRGRALWIAVAEGLPLPDPVAAGRRRRSFLLGADGAAAGAARAVVEGAAGGASWVWENGGVRLPLESRVWSEAERRRFLEADPRTDDSK